MARALFDFRARPRFDIRAQPGFGVLALFTFALLYLPIITLVVYAFNASDSLSSWGGFSLHWFAAAAQNQAVQDAAWRSLIIAVSAATMATIAATMAAIATTRTPPYPGLSVKYAFINLPLMVPEIVTAVALLIVFAKVKVWTGYTGLGYLILAHTAFCIPFAYLPIRARLEGMDQSLERAAADLYAPPWQVFRRVTLPLLRPGIIAGFMLAFVISLDDVVISEFVKSGGQDTLPTYMLGQLRRAVTPEINAIAAAFLVLSVALVTVFFFINRKKA
ncbi:ABC transporter permease [Ancylobacter rudongensis]|uniref:Spermidine/putrescine transport system permease protein PotC n=1 Tax=Ancylobacter rudongensis TaxID=177413 RepID=A0A1G4QIG9_9HYPH|nr:ABC transporter permease [Ancylobacter rudongensis]SCW44410.1 spermidine/putrescine transport system permease protein [Ancylobacter rudongensis]